MELHFFLELFLNFPMNERRERLYRTFGFTVYSDDCMSDNALYVRQCIGPLKTRPCALPRRYKVTGASLDSREWRWMSGDFGARPAHVWVWGGQ